MHHAVFLIMGCQTLERECFGIQDCVLGCRRNKLYIDGSVTDFLYYDNSELLKCNGDAFILDYTQVSLTLLRSSGPAIARFNTLAACNVHSLAAWRHSPVCSCASHSLSSVDLQKLTSMPDSCRMSC